MPDTPPIYELLRRRYPADVCALLGEVSNAAGYDRSNSCDYMVMNLWPSRGLELIGIEVKSSRSDWLRELKKPDKAEAFHKYCDRWYLLVTDDTICKLDELPATWGLLMCKGNKLVSIKEAAKLVPEQISRSLLAALLKRATKGLIHPSQIEDKLQEARDGQRDSNKRALESLQRDHDKLKKEVAEFETASGIKIADNWSYRMTPKSLGTAVHYLLERGNAFNFKQDLERDVNRYKDAVETLEKVIAKLEVIEA